MSKQNQKDNKELRFPDKIKFWFGIKPGHPEHSFHPKQAEESFLTSDFLKDLRADSSNINQRLKAIKQLSDDLAGKRLEDNGVEIIWRTVRDLLQSPQRTYRQCALNLLKSLIQTQFEWLGIMRACFFHVIQQHNSPEDLIDRLELLCLLTQNGREIDYFEEEIGSFLLHLIPIALISNKSLDFLQVLVNMIKFNSAYLDENVVIEIVRTTCQFACRTNLDKGVEACLDVLDAVISYSNLPSESLECIIMTLCRSVNVEKFCKTSLKLIRNLLGTHLGRSGLYTMCNILQQNYNLGDAPLLRGAVFFVGMCLWGAQKVSSLKISYSTILPFFLKALESRNLKVALEISFSIQRLIAKYGNELQEPTWDIILNIIDFLLSFIEDQETNFKKHGSDYCEHTSESVAREDTLTLRTASGSSSTLQAAVSNCVHDSLTIIEELLEKKQYSGCEDRLASILEKCSSSRPELSVLKLVDHYKQNVTPLKANWLINLQLLIEKYFKHEVRASIRIKVLDVIACIHSDNRSIYEDELIERIILPTMVHIELDSDLQVRNRAVQLLIAVALECSSKACMEILDVLERVVLHPFDLHGENFDTKETVHIIDENTILDVQTAIIGLLDIFKTKMYVLPSTLPLKAFKILVSHLQTQYHSISTGRQTGSLRAVLFEALLKLHASPNHHLGLPDQETKSIVYSPYLLCLPGDKPAHGAVSPPPMSPTPFSYPLCTPTSISLEPLFQVLATCLKQEKDWAVLKPILKELPKVLQNKTLLLSAYGSVGILCTIICSLVIDRSMKLPETLYNTPQEFIRSDFHSYVFPVLASFVSYHKYLDSGTQKLLVKCFQCGLNSKCTRTCIVALTLTILEMQDIMYKMLPDVLLGLSKISATVFIAIPVLEFLSTLICLPKLFASFVQDQYMSIFAIALPYTNPKFNHYVVSLAHHVIAMWFLKCRLSFRKGFVKYIIKGLRNNMSDDNPGIARSAQSIHSQTTQSDENSNKSSSKSSDPLTAFHSELIETCVDLLARYTFASCSVTSKRTPLAKFLLSSGQSLTWLVGNVLITITTSGCGSRSSKYGLCEKCLAQFKRGSASDFEEDLNLPPQAPNTDALSGRRRHRSAVQRSRSTEHHIAARRSQDDMQLRLTLERMSSVDSSSRSSRLDLDSSCITEGIENFKTSSDFGTHICSCWYQGWAEILIRRPSGNVSWMMKIQNQFQLANGGELPLAELASLVFPITDLIHEETPGDSEEDTNIKQEVAPGNVSVESTEVPNKNLEKEETKNEPSLQALKFEEKSKSTENKRDTKIADSPNLSSKEVDGKAKMKSESTAPPLSLSKRSQSLKSPDDEMCKKFSSFASDRRFSFVADTTVASAANQHPAIQESSSDLDLAPMRRDRGHTISVMTPAQHKWQPGSSRSSVGGGKEGYPTGINPSFIFLQLYHSYRFGIRGEKPLLLPRTEAVERGVKNLDRIPPYETHKIGIVYVGKDQANNETEILANEYGSVRYANFLSGLGHLIKLKDVDPQEMYVGGLEQSGNDGKFAYMWQDDVMQVIFHIATLMPTKPSDPLCNQKKLHIGNDFVTIVYNDSERDYDMQTIRGQFIYACVIIQPLDQDSSLVTIKHKPELENTLVGHGDPKIVSDQNLAILVRQLALHANLASVILQSQLRSPKDPYASNWLERLRHIKRLKAKCQHSVVLDDDIQKPLLMDDFTDFI